MPEMFGSQGPTGAPPPRPKKTKDGKNIADARLDEPAMLYGSQQPQAGEGPKGRYVQYDNESGAMMLNLPSGVAKYKRELEEDLMDEFYGEAAGGVDAHRSIDVWVKDWIDRKAKEDPSVLEDIDQG